MISNTSDTNSQDGLSHTECVVGDNISDKPTIHDIETLLQTVYDPEFPYIDIYNMGLIYTIDIADDIDGDNDGTIHISQPTINICMTLTTPACPAADLIVNSIKETIMGSYPDYDVSVVVVFDPPRTPEMIKDEDLQKMFL